MAKKSEMCDLILHDFSFYYEVYLNLFTQISEMFFFSIGDTDKHRNSRTGKVSSRNI